MSQIDIQSFHLQSHLYFQIIIFTYIKSYYSPIIQKEQSAWETKPGLTVPVIM